MPGLQNSPGVPGWKIPLKRSRALILEDGSLFYFRNFNVPVDSQGECCLYHSAKAELSRVFNRILRVMNGELTIVFEPAEEGGFTAYIPEVPGAISEGETLDEAREMVIDALRELVTFRREQAMQSKGSAALVERLALGF